MNCFQFSRQFGGCAKLRTGGVVEEAFPAVDKIAGFIARCAELGVPFKATAGLHHPLRCFRPLTYEPDSPRASDARIPEPLYRGGDCLERGALGQSRVARRARHLPCRQRTRKLALRRRRADLERRREPIRIDVEALRSMRSKFALSFGSCSFEEPLQDLHELDLL